MTRAERLAAIRERFELIYDQHEDEYWLLSQLALADAVVEAARKRYLSENAPCPHPDDGDGMPCGVCLCELATTSADVGSALAKYDAGGAE